MHKQTFVAAVLALGLTGAAARAELPTCEAFMTRLRDAGRALTFPLPTVKIERKRSR